MLILIAGLPGTGKTTVAKAFSRKYGAIHLNSDSVRRELGLWGTYRPADKARVYAELLGRTRASLLQGKTVIVDSTFFRRDLRRPFVELAEQLGVKVCWVMTTAPDAVLHERVARPRSDSEADEAVLEKIQPLFEPLEQPFLALETSAATPEVLADMINAYLEHG